MNFLPCSKHLQILTEVPDVFLRSLTGTNIQAREEFSDRKIFGANSVKSLSWKDLLDCFSCTQCGRCQDVCPAAATGKSLNPRLMVHAIKENLLGGGAGKGSSGTPLIGAGKLSSTEASLWSCTSCGACMEACPVFLEHLPKIVKMRPHLVQMDAKFPEQLLNLSEDMEQRSNPWGMAPSERSKWSSQLELSPFEEHRVPALRRLLPRLRCTEQAGHGRARPGA